MAFAHDAGEPPLSANFGLQDQRAALRWAQQQLDSLGGDPMRVMIFGESAGAMSVMLHTVSPPSEGLFRRVMAESGSPHDTWPTAWAVQRSAAFGALLNCTVNATLATRLSCLRRATPPCRC